MANEIKTTCVPVSYLVLGPLDNNVYIVDDGVGCFVVDPSCDADRILDELGGRHLDAIILTHGHGDHMGAALDLREATNAPVYASSVEAPYVTGKLSFGRGLPKSAPCPVDHELEDGDIIEIGAMKWQVIFTPGHTFGGICLFMDPGPGATGAPILISGDTLFAGTHGRVDFDEGDIDAMRESLVKLASLPPETVVLPGHSGMTTIARESGWLRLCCL